MNQKLINRLQEFTQAPNLFEVLSDKLTLPDLQSLLLAVYEKRVQDLSPKNIFNQYTQNRFVRPAAIDPQKLISFDQFAFSILPKDFSAIELSPVSPLGANFALTPISQNFTVTTIRNTEVCSDPTNMLALECASRRKKLLKEKPRSCEQIKCCTSLRVLRAQPFNEDAAFAHFRLFVLCTAGKDEGSFKFESEALKEHIDFYLTILSRAKEINFDIKNIRVLFLIYNPAFEEFVRNIVIASLQAAYPHILFAADSETKTGFPYYKNLRFQIFAQNADCEEYFIADGGFTDWTQQLLNSKKERLLTSGIGSERFIYCFGKK